MPIAGQYKLTSAKLEPGGKVGGVLSGENVAVIGRCSQVWGPTRWHCAVRVAIAPADHSPRPGSVWNRIPPDRRDDLSAFTLKHEALTPRELALKYTDEKQDFISEPSAYRILKAADLITTPDYVVIKVAEEFTEKTTAINEMWQTDFTYFEIIGWGWCYLCTIPDDYSRYIIA